MTRILSVLCLPLLAAATVARGIPQADARAASGTPTISARLEGSRSVVFESLKDSCNQNDIPDSMARAFRDFSGTVYLVASSSEMFQNLGPTLEDVHHTCQPAFQSVGDPDPTGIIHFRGWYYAVATAWTWPPNCSGQGGLVLA